MFHGNAVCIDAFHFLHDVSRKTTRQLKQQYATHGIEAKVHENVNKTSLAKSMPFAEVQRAVKFIENYALTNALVLPGRISGQKNPDILILPYGSTKRNIHALYQAAS